MFMKGRLGFRVTIMVILVCVYIQTPPGVSEEDSEENENESFGPFCFLKCGVCGRECLQADLQVPLRLVRVKRARRPARAVACGRTRQSCMDVHHRSLAMADRN